MMVVLTLLAINTISDAFILYDYMDDLDCIVLCGGKCGSSTLHHTMMHNGYKTIKVHDKDFLSVVLVMMVY
jgi:hypothetical protein